MSIPKLHTKQTIATRAKAEVAARGQSIRSFCQICGFAPESLYDNQRCSSVGSDMLYKLCDELNVSADYLLGLSEDKELRR